MADANLDAETLGTVSDNPVDVELSESFLSYAMSVIISRALPDARDGMKPVHRRILYSMRQSGLRPDGGYVKSARVVGDCFPAGTLVRTENGLQTVENIHVGDTILNGRGERAEVTKLFANPSSALTTLTLADGLEMSVTPGQKFRCLDEATYSEKWVRAENLEAGDLLLMPDVAVKTGVCTDSETAYVAGLLTFENFFDHTRPTEVGEAHSAPVSRMNRWARENNLAVTLQGFQNVHTDVSSTHDIRSNENCEAPQQLQAALGEDSWAKKVPDFILAARSSYPAFLAGFFDAAGKVENGTRERKITFVNISQLLLTHIRAMLVECGVHSTLTGDTQGLFVLTVEAGDAVTLAGILQPEVCNVVKSQQLATIHSTPTGTPRVLRNRKIPSRAILAALHISEEGDNQTGTPLAGGGTALGTSGAVSFSQLRSGGIIAQLEISGSELAGNLNWLVDNFRCVKVAKVQHGKIVAPTYDFLVDSEDHELVVEGVRVHNCMGKYHPHGDSAIYAAMVRLAQDFQLRVPLVDGHGNFGTLIDSAAASRYTEARMTHASLILTDGLDENTVDMVDNYDGRLKEPSVLPAAFPNLLVNGTNGIAVGMSTLILPHNLPDVTKAASALLQNPDITVGELADMVIGPDLPSGGVLLNPDGARDAYLTGRGQVTIGSVSEVLTDKKGHTSIVFTELPYQISAEKVVERLNDLIRDAKLPEVSRVMDLSDRKNGTRLVIELRRNTNPSKVLAYINRHTPTRTSFHLHHLALIDNVPVTANLKELLHAYTTHRCEVVRRRSQFRRDKAAARLHILDGLLLALTDIDAVIVLLRSAENTAAAREKLIEQMKMSEIQANAVLEMPLRRLTSLETDVLKKEAAELRGTIKALDTILGSEKILIKTVIDELNQTAAQFGEPRRTKIGGETNMAEEDALDEVAETYGGTGENVVTVVDSGTHIRRVLATDWAKKPSKTDKVSAAVCAPGGAAVAWVTNTGHLLYTSASSLPDVGEPGVKVETVVDLDTGEKVVAGFSPADTTSLVFVTRKGLVKRLLMSAAPKRSANAMRIDDGDEVVAVCPAGAENERLTVLGSNSNVWSTAVEKIPAKGSAAGGVAGMKLPEDAHVICAAVTNSADEGWLITSVANNGDVHTSTVAEYPLTGRGGGGVRGQKLRSGAENVQAGFVHKAGELFTPGPRSTVVYGETVVARGRGGAAADGMALRWWPVNVGEQ